MAFYSHPPIQLYAYAPMAIPNQPEFYAVYPSGGHPAGVVDASAFYYDANPKGMMAQSTGMWSNGAIVCTFVSNQAEGGKHGWLHDILSSLKSPSVIL